MMSVLSGAGYGIISIAAQESFMTAAPIRVLLVDDHEVVRRGLQAILERNVEITVVGEAGTVAGAVQEAERVRPDVVVMDLRLPDGSGVDACRQVRAQDENVKVLILTSHADEDALFSAVLAGASGYVLKDLDPTGLQKAIIDVGRGGSLLDPQMATRVLDRMRRGAGQHPADDPFASLSPQEGRILEMIGDGMTNRTIAEHLSLSEKTIKNYVSDIYSKLHIERRSQASRLITERQMRKDQT